MKKSYRLYHFPFSPFCRKVRLVLAEKKMEVDAVEEKYWEQRQEFLQMNPAGKVPVLRSGDMILSDSQAICEYLEETCPDPPLFPESPLARHEMRRLVFWFDEKFYQEVTSRLVYERLVRRMERKGSPEPNSLQIALKNIKPHLDYLEHLLHYRRWLAGDRMTLADFTAAAHLSCLDYMNDVDWRKCQTVKDWYAAMKSRPGFRSLLADHIPGQHPPSHYTDLDF